MARRRGQGDWVPCDFYGQDISVTTAAGGAEGPLTGFLLVRHGMTSDLGQPPMNHPQVAVIEPSDDISVERVVGQIEVRRTDSAVNYAWLAMRITKVVFDEDSNQFASWEDSLFDADDANSPFLWQRYVKLAELTPGINLAYLGVDMMWSHLDVRVGRLLERNEALMMLLQARPVGTAPGPNTWQIMPFLRSWCGYSH